MEKKMTLYSRRNILATSAAGSLAAAAVISGSSAETYSAAAISDPGRMTRRRSDQSL